MKNKRVLILFCALVAVVVVVILTSVLFTIRETEVEVANTSFVLDAQKIREDIASQKGTSIIVLNERTLTAQIEQNFPYVRVISIERVFPSTLRVYVEERYEVYALVRNNEFIHIDAYGKVLRISESPASRYDSTVSVNNIKVTLPVAELPKSLKVGDKLVLNSDSSNGRMDLLEQLYTSSRMETFEYRQYIQSVSLDTLDVAMVQMQSGAIFKFYSYSEKLSSYVANLHFIFGKLDTADKRRIAVISFVINKEGKIEVQSNVEI